MNDMINTLLGNKSSVEEIRINFDNDVERFSNLETGQVALIDAPLAMELITRAAVATTTKINRVLDIGCGAGNNTLKLLQYTSGFDCDLIDLSSKMLNKAYERISAVNLGTVRIFQQELEVIIMVS